MKIHFQTQDTVPGMTGHAPVKAEQISQIKTGKNTDQILSLGSVSAAEAMFDAPRSGKSLAELQAEAEGMDVGVMQDYQTVMAHTLSAEDYAKAREEGFSYRDMEPEDIVTIQDRVKAEIAKGGTVVAGYNDDMSAEELAGIVGSAALAAELMRAFGEADLPMTEENAADLSKAWDLAKDLTVPTEPEIRYLAANELTGSLWDLYIARSSGAKLQTQSAAPAAPIDLSAPENAGLDRQLREMAAGEEASYEDAKWLLQNELPVSEGNLDLLKKIREIPFPVEETRFADAAAAAVSEGKKPVFADLSVTTDPYRRAASLGEEILSKFADPADLTRTRQMEEIRLSMTAEVNVKLIESGFSIDTASIEETIEALKQAEKEVAEKYFPEKNDHFVGERTPEQVGGSAVQKLRLMNEANRIFAEIPTLPAAGLRVFAEDESNEVTVTRFHAEGTAFRDTYEKANESYEALMTAPRADLGDSIRKAFGNAGELAKQIGQEDTEENRRIVRILGYSRMEVSPENFEKIREADSLVRSTVQKMTPASVLRMIRDGVNPLEKSFDELNRYFDEKLTAGESGDPSEQYRRESESYSRFLYVLERDREITEAERESYVGIYRLLHQIEGKDGSAVGAVVSEQVELTFSNLLSAVRSGKYKSGTRTIDDTAGAFTAKVRSAASITEQIGSAYRELSARDAQELGRELEELRRSAAVPREAAEILRTLGEPETAGNLLASAQLLSGEGSLFSELLKRERTREDKQDLRTRMENALGELAGAEDPEASAERFYAELEEAAQEMSFEVSSTEDVRLLQSSRMQLHLAGVLCGQPASGDRKEYILPVEIGEEILPVRLTFQTTGAAEQIRIRVNLSDNESLEADLGVREGRVDGIVTTDSAETVNKLASLSDIFSETLAAMPGDFTAGELRIGESEGRENLKQSQHARGTDAVRESSEGSDQRHLFGIAKSFLQAIGRIASL